MSIPAISPAVAPAPAPLPPSTSAGRIRTLDGLRAVSICLVIFGHMAGFATFPQVLRGISDFANFGVRIFFVISGFLITTLLLREQRKAGRISLKNFYLRRVFRIFPASYSYIGVVTALAAAGLIHFERFDLLAACTYWMNFHIHRSWWIGHMWSLAIEEQFYLLWPAVLAFGGWKWGRRVTIAALLCGPISRLLIWYFLPAYRDGIGDIFPTAADALACGCLLAGSREWLWNWKPYRTIIESPLFFCVPLMSILCTKLGGSARPYLLIVSFMNLGIMVTLDWCMRNADGLLGKVLEFKPIAFVGVLSYSLYLWQQLFMNYHHDAIFPQTPWIALLALGAAMISYFAIERPFLAIKDKYFH